MEPSIAAGAIVGGGRLVEKKGFDVLLNALAQLPTDLHWQLRILEEAIFQTAPEAGTEA